MSALNSAKWRGRARASCGRPLRRVFHERLLDEVAERVRELKTDDSAYAQGRKSGRHAEIK
eukprot:5406359-Pleurochrysis_carterae.AAC.2